MPMPTNSATRAAEEREEGSVNVGSKGRTCITCGNLSACMWRVHGQVTGNAGWETWDSRHGLQDEVTE